MKIGIKSLFVLIAGVLFLSPNVFSQGPQAPKNKPNGSEIKNKSSFKVNGRVKDASTSEFLEYVNVVILNAKDSSLVNGTITDKNGKFLLDSKKGKYLLRLTFIGYKDTYHTLEIKNEDVNLGVIKLDLGSQALEGVEITAERSMMEYQLDKRVINVDKNIVSAGGSATDVLENVPSVSVDQDGNVSLRGSGNVTVLVDGRPSELLGSDLQTVLEQIPSSTIESIEVITNPSAKYNPEGMSGIINIVLKEKGNRGFNGSVSASTGLGINTKLDGDQFLFPQTSLSAALNYSTKKYAIYFDGSLRYFDMANYGFSDKTINNIDPKINILQDRYSTGNRLGRGFKIGGDWYINNQNTISLSYNLRKGGSSPNTESIERLYSREASNPLDSSNTNNYFGLETSTREMFFQNFTLNYEKKFNKKGQLLTLDANWNIGEFSRENTQIRSFEEGSEELFYLRNFSKSNNDRSFVTLNYVHPFSESLKLETGYNLNYVNTEANYDYFSDENMGRNDSMSYVFKYKESIHAFYGTLAYSFNKKLSAQLGLRLEQVFRDGSKTQNDSTLLFPKDPDTKNYFSVYPTLHISYNFTDSQSGQISYSRRIRRPDHWSLAPYIDINNPEYIRFGNPDILPEYTDAFEIGYSKIFQKTTIFTSLYYRRTNNAITDFSFVWNENNAKKYGFDWVWDVAGEEYADSIRIASTSMNLAKSSNYGMEVIIDQKITKWWKANLSANLYGNYEDGREFGGELVETLNWDAKLNTTMTFPQNWVIQISGQYIPKRENIQGYSDPMYWFDLSVKKDILNKKGSLSLRFSDVFNTRQRSSYTITDNFKQYSVNQRTSQYLVLSFNYRFGIVNKEQMMKEKKRQSQQNAASDDFGGEE
ncbi:MAG: TonB-dependent receptor [Bacteroidales bacterium]